VKNPVGTVKRFSAAVVVNHRPAPPPAATKAGAAAKGAPAKPATVPLSAEEMEQITALAKEAMGFSQTRGDSINVVNAPFSKEEREVVPEVPVWKQPETIALAADGGKLLAAALVILYVLFGVVRPLLKSVAAAPRFDPAIAGELPGSIDDDPAPAMAQRLASAKQLAKSDPKAVAGVVKNWVSSNG
jgi:flagellar M-ring protein FliF